jgi:hypothetical protein
MQQPTTARTPSGGLLGASIALALVILFLWSVVLSTLRHLTGSDAAGNGLAQFYAAAELVLLWIFLAILMIVAGANGAMPTPAIFAAFILIPASGYAALKAVQLLSEPNVAPFLWPLVVPEIVPPLVIAFCFWTLLPPLRAAIPAFAAVGIVWGGTLIASASLWPMLHMRHVVVAQEDSARAKRDADFASLPADASLWDLTPFLTRRNEAENDGVLARIRALPRRQSDAEVMLDRGDFPLRYLRDFNLTLTPELCDKARSLLRRRVEPLVLDNPNSKPYATIAEEVADATVAIEWLVGYGCSCDAESLAWETMANAYRDTNFDVVRLRELRDPQELNWAVRQNSGKP